MRVQTNRNSVADFKIKCGDTVFLSDGATRKIRELRQGVFVDEKYPNGGQWNVEGQAIVSGTYDIVSTFRFR